MPEIVLPPSLKKEINMYKVGDKVLAIDGKGKKYVALINEINGCWYQIGSDWLLDSEIETAPIKAELGWIKDA